MALSAKQPAKKDDDNDKKAAKGGKRRGRVITDESRRRGRQSKRQRSVFNKYMEAIQPRPISERHQKRLSEIELILSRGTVERSVPVFGDPEGTGRRRRVGTTRKMVPMKPAERVKLINEQRKLQAPTNHGPSGSLRAEFLAMLPAYADRLGLSRESLEEAGVPAADLDEAGLRA